MIAFSCSIATDVHTNSNMLQITHVAMATALPPARLVYYSIYVFIIVLKMDDLTSSNINQNNAQKNDQKPTFSTVEEGTQPWPNI